MFVRVVKVDELDWHYEARAWVNEEEIYSRDLTTMYWSAPLADMGARGWELVAVSPENALWYSSWVEGLNTSSSRPVQMDFFFKRPI
jgi:hypothetical protein